MKLISAAINLPKRAVRSIAFRTNKAIRRGVSQSRIKLASRKILQKHRESGLLEVGGTAKNEVPLKDNIATLLSYKVTDDDRLYILKTVINQLKHSLHGSQIPWHVIDASDEIYLEQTKLLYKTDEFSVRFDSSSKRLTEAYLEMLYSIEQRYFYLQFDDFVSVGLKPEFLESCCQLLEKYEGLVDVVAIMWPQSVNVSRENNAVEVLAYETKPTSHKKSYQFGFGGPQIPVCIETIGQYEFAIFENFVYGFFFNHLIAPTKDYRERMEWFMNNVSRTSVHQIELAAEDRTLGPYWTHVAICLSDIALLDLDYAHTVEAVRPENRANKEICDALNQEYSLKATHS